MRGIAHSSLSGEGYAQKLDSAQCRVYEWRDADFAFETTSSIVQFIRCISNHDRTAFEHLFSCGTNVQANGPNFLLSKFPTCQKILIWLL